MAKAKKSPSNQVNAGRGKKAKDSETRRRGPRGHFLGSRKVFLEGYLPAYLACKRGNRGSFWHELQCSWWDRYPWKLNDDQEPPTDDPEEMAKLASVEPDEEDKKALVEGELIDRLKRWFTNHASSASTGSRRDVLSWTPLLQRLHQVRNVRPRQRTATQQFMRDHSDVVKAAFSAEYGDGKDLTNTQRMNSQHEVAKALLYKEYAHLVDGLGEKAKAEHAVGMKEWDVELTDIALAEDVVQARESLFDAVYPLLQAIGSYVGCYVSLVAGSPAHPTDEGFFTAVHWRPGDRSSTKSWTQWDAEGFNSGVAGPFMKYARETNESLIKKSEGLSPGIQTPQVSLPVMSPTVTPVPDHSSFRDVNRVQLQVTATRPHAMSRPPTAKPSMAEAGAKKRKHATKPSHPLSFGDSESDEADDRSGDGFSSGESLSSNESVHPKRQKTSTIATRSSTRTSRTGGLTDSTSSALAATGPSPGNLDTAAPDRNMGITTPAVAKPTNPLGHRSADTSEDVTDAYTPLIVDPPPLGARDAPIREEPVITDSNSEDTGLTIAKSPAMSDVEDPAVVETGVPVATNSALSSPTPTLSDAIDAAEVPKFLLSHGTGKRMVNIFAYLKRVTEPRFQQVLLEYLRFENHVKTAVEGKLPAPGRPAEVSQWLARARPADLPDFTKGGRTFTDFVDCTFAWWASLQPSWRDFRRDRVSREVKGTWGVLHAPRTNGVLSVVVIVYWWAQVLEKDKRMGSAHADYELFAEDVAWVLSKLPN